MYFYGWPELHKTPVGQNYDGPNSPVETLQDGNFGKCPKQLPNEKSMHTAWRTDCGNDLTFVVKYFDNSIGAGKMV